MRVEAIAWRYDVSNCLTCSCYITTYFRVQYTRTYAKLFKKELDPVRAVRVSNEHDRLALD